jgi:hypothetical protein
LFTFHNTLSPTELAEDGSFNQGFNWVSPSLRAALVMGGPIFVRKLTLINLNSQYARVRSAFDFPRKAISVLSNDKLWLFAGRLFKIIGLLHKGRNIEILTYKS